MLSGRFEHDLVGLRGADGGDDALADAGDDGFLLRAADEAVEIGADGDAGADLHLDAVLGDAVDGAAAGGRVRAVDDLRIDRGADGFDHAFAGALGGEVDGAGAVPIQRDAGFLRGDERLDGGDDVAAGEVVGLDVIDGDFDAGLFRGDAGVHDHAVGHLAEAHGDEVGEADVGAGQPGAEPDAEEGDDDAEEQQSEDGDDDQDDGRSGWIMALLVRFGLEITMRRKLSAPMTSSGEPAGAWPDWQKAS